MIVPGKGDGETGAGIGDSGAGAKGDGETGAGNGGSGAGATDGDGEGVGGGRSDGGGDGKSTTGAVVVTGGRSFATFSTDCFTGCFIRLKLSVTNCLSVRLLNPGSPA